MKKNVVKLKQSDIKELVQRIIKEEGEERSSRYMFFSNLEQIHRQASMLLEMDEMTLEQILENGHDWAQDHVAEAKNNMDQVFDFIMNKTKEPEDVHVDMMEEKWSKKYKESINCNNPKGFSQKAHCQGRKKRMDENRELLNQLVGSDNKNQNLDEGIKDWIVGGTLALATMLGGPAKAQAQKIYPDMEMSNLNKRDAKKVEELILDLDNEDKYFQVIDTMNSINPEDSSYLENDDDTKELIKTMDVIRTKYYKKGVGPTYPVAKRIQYKGEKDSGEKFHDQRITFPDYDEEGNYQMKKVPDIYTSEKGTAYTPNIYKNEKEKQKYYDKVGKEVSTGNYKSKMWRK